MSKKLNSGLFEELSGGPAPMAPSPALPSMAQAHPSPAARMEIQKLFEEFQILKTKMRGYESQVDVIKNQMAEFVRTIDQRFERVSQALSRLEKAMHAQGREMDTKVRTVREKIQSQGFEEAKIEGLIERQNLVIRNFENRLAAMQKVINEKELLLLKYFEALKHYQGQNPKK